MQEFSYADSSLMVESIPLRSAAERHGTPLYVYSKHSIIDHCRHLENAFGGEAHMTYYAVKANANRTLLSIIAGEGLGADVGSRGELFLALRSGVAPEKITFSGVGKRDDEIAYALEHNIWAFNVESGEEIDLLDGIAGRMGRIARILLRVNLDIDAGGHEYISTSLKQNKFGIPWQQAKEMLHRVAGLQHIEIRGLHSHIGSQIVKSETFLRAARAILSLVQELRASGIPIQDVDFGGGFGVQYRGYISHPLLPREVPEEAGLSAATLVRDVLPLLKETGCRISIQPGRSIIAHAGVLVVRVLYRKASEEKIFVVVDGGMNDLIRPTLYHSYHQIVPLEVNGAPLERADVVGPLCESGDFFALDRPLPRVSRGDYLAIMGAGAYGYVLASNYNARPRPAEVLVDGSSVTVIRERESVEAL